MYILVCFKKKVGTFYIILHDKNKICKLARCERTHTYTFGPEESFYF